MLYEFQLKKNTGLNFIKLSEGNYIIGTKKVSAKINNGILLIRVGGGYMDIENFFKQYGEQELAKQLRQEAANPNHQVEGERLSIEGITNAQRAAAKMKGSGQKSGRNSNIGIKKNNSKKPNVQND